MNEPIRTKRYVCPFCSGSGKNSTIGVEDPPVPDFLVDCVACVKQGLPSFVELPLPSLEVTVK